MRKIILHLLFLSSIISLSAQDTTGARWSLNGYVKSLETAALIHAPSPDLISGNLIHNRLEFRYLPNDHWTFAVDARNRFFFGEQIKITPDPAAQIDYNDRLDLSWFWLNQSYAVGHTVLDRAYIDIQDGPWQVRVGRQRINWGIGDFWNPNDWFNAFNFFDWDYEERPGSDAIRIQYYSGFASHVEIAARPGKNWNGSTAAALWRFNKWNFDFQLLGGIDRGDLALGAGWTGYLSSLGMNGELSYFRNYSKWADTSGSISASVGLSYLFPSNFYMGYSFLYNSGGSTEFDGNNPLFFNDLSAKNLSPFRYNMIMQVAYPATPLIIVNAGAMYSPGVEAWILFPGISFSLCQNLDFDLLGQFFSLRGKGKIPSQELIYARLKWSF